MRKRLIVGAAVVALLVGGMWLSTIEQHARQAKATASTTTTARPGEGQYGSCELLLGQVALQEKKGFTPTEINQALTADYGRWSWQRAVGPKEYPIWMHDGSPMQRVRDANTACSVQTGYWP